MNALQQFLTANSVENVVEDINLGGRLSEFTFQIKAITGDQYNSYQTQCIENPNSPKKRKFNSRKFNELVVINHVSQPNFKDAEWLKEAVCIDSTTLMYRTLLAGEISELAEKILNLSGFDRDIEEEKEEVKNS